EPASRRGRLPPWTSASIAARARRSSGCGSDASPEKTTAVSRIVTRQWTVNTEIASVTWSLSEGVRPRWDRDERDRRLTVEPDGMVTEPGAKVQSSPPTLVTTGPLEEAPGRGS